MEVYRWLADYDNLGLGDGAIMSNFRYRQDVGYGTVRRSSLGGIWFHCAGRFIAEATMKQ